MSDRFVLRRVCAALWLAQGATPAMAASDGCSQGVLLAFENDYFGRGKVGTDRWYTTGLHSAWGYRRDCQQEAVRTLRAVGRTVLTPQTEEARPTLMASAGLNMYTPRDIEDPNPQPFDRPWAGYLFGGVGTFVYEGRSHKLADIKLGLIGPASMADKLQIGLHKLIDDDRPAGWHNQLRPRLGVQASYTHTQRWSKVEWPLLPQWAGVHTHVRGTLGNVKTLGAIGVTLIAGERERVMGAPDEGDNLGVDFNERANFFHGPDWLRALTFYAQVQAAYVAHNIFITGTTFGEQPQISIKREVWLATLGVSVRRSAKHRFEYRIKWRSPEFDAPGLAPDDRIQRYGEVRYIRDFDS